MALFIFTNDYHHLVWTYVALDATNPLLPLIHPYAVGFWGIMGYLLVVVVTGCFVFYREVPSVPHLFVRQSSVVVYVAFGCIFAAILDIVLFGPMGLNTGIGFVHWAFATGSILLLFVFRRVWIGDILPVASETVLEGMGDLVILLDTEGHIIDLNPAAEKMCGHTINEICGKHIKEMCPLWPSREELTGIDGRSGKRIALDSGVTQRIYDVYSSPLLDHQGNNMSDVCVLRDVTDLEGNLQLLDQKNMELVRRNAQLAKVREIALGIDTVSTVEEVWTQLVELSRDIPGVRFVIVQQLDESGRFITTPYYSKIRNQAIANVLNKLGFDPDVHLGKTSASGMFQFRVAESKVARDYLRNRRTVVSERLAELTDGVMNSVLADSLQRAVNLKKFVIVPIHSLSQPQRSLIFFLHEEVPLDILEMVGAHCSAALQNIITIEQLKEEISERRRAEDEREHSDYMLKEIMDSTRDGLALLDITGKVIHVNKRLLEFSGYSPEEITGKRFKVLKMFPPQSIAKMAVGFAQAVSGTLEQPIEVEGYTKIGEKKVLEMNASLLRDGGKAAQVFVIMRNITERKQWEEALIKANVWLRALQGVTASIHSTLDLKSILKYITDGAIHNLGYTTAFIVIRNDEKKCFEMMSISTKKKILSQIEKILGFSLKELSIPTDPEMIPGLRPVLEGRMVIAKNLADIGYPLFSKEICFAIQKLRRTKNYIVLPLELEKELVGGVLVTSPREEVSEEELDVLKVFAGAASDALRNANLLVQSKRAEEAVRDGQEKLQKMFESATDAITVTDLNGVITECNERTVELHSFGSKDEVIGKSAFDLIAPSDHEWAKVNMQKTLTEGSIENIEYTLFRADGSEFPGELSASVLKGASGSPLGFIAFTRDITERKRMEEQLQHSQLLASMGEMTAGIAHEVGNPLASILLYSELVMKSGISPKAKKDLMVVHDEAKRAGQLMKDLLAYSRRVTPDMHRVDMQNILKKVLDMRRYEQTVHNITLSVNSANDPLRVWGDSSQLMQVFMNLILNAEEALGPSKGGNILVTTHRNGQWAKVSVADNGTGIPENNLNQVFHPFFTTKPIGSGTGLGLSVCYGIVTNHNGLIHAENNKMGGATFTVELPLAKAGKQETPILGDRKNNYDLHIAGGSARGIR